MPCESHHRISRQRQNPLSPRSVIFTSGQAARSCRPGASDGAGVLGGVDVAGAEVGREQLVAAEDVERQEAVMIVVAVEEAALLLAVDAVVGGVEVEDQMLRRRRVRGDELIDQDLGDLDQGLAVDAVLQAAEGRRRGQRQLRLGGLPGGELKHGVDAEVLVVVEVLVPQGDRRDPLGDHGALVVDDEDGVSGVGDGGVEGVEQADLVGDLAEEQRPGVGGEPAALGWKAVPKCRSMRSATRAAVHSSVRQPWALAPCRSSPSSRLRSASVEAGRAAGVGLGGQLAGASRASFTQV